MAHAVRADAGGANLVLTLNSGDKFSQDVTVTPSLSPSKFSATLNVTHIQSRILPPVLGCHDGLPFKKIVQPKTLIVYAYLIYLCAVL